MTTDEIATFCVAKIGIIEESATVLAAKFARARYSMIWDNHFWRQSRVQDLFSAASGQAVLELPETWEGVEAVRPIGQGLLTPISDHDQLALDPISYGSPGPMISFSPLPRTATEVARIRLHQVPDKPTSLLILGKAKCPGLPTGTSKTELPGVDQCLIAFVMADLEQWNRQHDKAQLYLREANALLQAAKDAEANQSAEIRRIIPEGQYMEGDW